MEELVTLDALSSLITKRSPLAMVAVVVISPAFVILPIAGISAATSFLKLGTAALLDAGPANT